MMRRPTKPWSWARYSWWFIVWAVVVFGVVRLMGIGTGGSVAFAILGGGFIAVFVTLRTKPRENPMTGETEYEYAWEGKWSVPF